MKVKGSSDVVKTHDLVKISTENLKAIYGNDYALFQEKILSSCYCSHCLKTKRSSAIVNYKIFVNELNDIILQGFCANCGGKIGRYLETGTVGEYVPRIKAIKKTRGCKNMTHENVSAGQKTNLDLTSFSKAIAQMEEALAYCGSKLAKEDAKLALHLRAAAIQAFEFTYELSFKTLKRHLEMTEVNPAVIEEMNFNDLVRRGYELGLLQAEMADWREFRKDRGTTSHAYDEEKAKDVFASIPRFLTEAKFLLTQIQKRQRAKT